VKISLLLILALLIPAPEPNATAAVHYVDLSSANPTPPYADWSTAATNIQDAITAADAGDIIWVTNGVYQTGGKSLPGSFLTNRVALDKPLTVTSVNGPTVTLIQGARGRSQARCAYLTNGALLAGFTLTNGTASEQVTSQGGGVYCQSATARLTNCILTGNSALSGGGAYQGTLDNCTFRSNSATTGGAAYQATLNNCVVTGNSATSGGGAAFGTLNNCTVTGNSASSSGGGVYQAALNNCIVYFNTSPGEPNTSGSKLNYCCTVPASGLGKSNISSDPQLASVSHLSAGSPCRGAGSAAFASGSDIDGELWANPPSIGCDEYRLGNVMGPLTVSISATYTNVAPGFALDFTGTIEGKTSASVWDFGDGMVLSNRPYASHAWTGGGSYPVVLTAYNEDHPAGVSATVLVQVAAQTIFYVSQESTNPIAPYTNWATAATDIQSAVDQALLPGQSVLVSNGVYQTGGRFPPGLSTTNRVAIPRALRVASVNGPVVTVIQGQRSAGGGGLGADAVRCVYLASGAVLDGFTLSTGSTASFDSGGGVYCASAAAIVTNCIFHANYAYLGAGAFSGTLNNCLLRFNAAYAYGGGGYQTTFNYCALTNNVANFEGGNASYGTLNNCIITEGYGVNNGGGTRYSTANNCILWRNRADRGGGAYQSTLNNCTLVDNYAYVSGGGSYASTLRNCIVYNNGSPSSPNSLASTLNYCCTTPDSGSGAGNITNAPLFVGQAGFNLRLQSNSPCINAGRNTYAPAGADLDGNPRVVGSTVDMGAYEFQAPLSLLSYGWAQQYGLPADGSADSSDPDEDGLNNWQEWIAGTDPTNAASVLRLQPPVVAGTGNVIVSWSSVTTRSYSLECATDLVSLSSFQLLSSNITGKAGSTTFTNVGVFGDARRFYRVRVEQ
jgi:hypothetical protein